MYYLDLGKYLQTGFSLSNININTLNCEMWMTSVFLLKAQFDLVQKQGVFILKSQRNWKLQCLIQLPSHRTVPVNF